MAVLRIRTFGDPVLRQKARAVEAISDIHRRLIDDMFDTMREAQGVGLAAPQVGVLERIFVWEFEGESGAMVNPAIVASQPDEVEGEEACLSIPGLVYPVMRSVGVRVEATDARGEPITFDVEDWLARVFQHEIDHLDGVLFIDRLPEDLRREATRLLAEQALGLPMDRSPHARPAAQAEERF